MLYITLRLLIWYERTDVGIGKIRDMDVITHTGSIPSVIINTKQLESRTTAQHGIDYQRYQMEGSKNR